MTGEGYVFPRGFASKFQVYNSNLQNIPNAVVTTIQVNTKVFDLLNEVSLATFGFTPAQAGYYLIQVYGGFTPALPAGTLSVLALYVNVVDHGRVTIIENGVSVRYLTFSRMFYLTPADTVYMRVSQNSGVGQNWNAGPFNQIFEGFRVA